MNTNKTSVPREELLLDALYESRDPAVKQFLNIVMYEEMEQAHERAVMRVATQYAHLLPPKMQHILASRYAVAMTA